MANRTDRAGLVKNRSNPQTAREFLSGLMAKGQTLTEISRRSGVPQSSLHRHVVHKLPMSPQNARRLEEWSEGAISAVLMLERNELA